MYVRNGFFHFCGLKLAKIRGYNQGLLSKRDINIKNKWRIMFLFLMAIINVLVLIFSLPPIQDLIHWLLPVGVSVLVFKYDVDYGISMALP